MVTSPDVVGFVEDGGQVVGGHLAAELEPLVQLKVKREAAKSARLIRTLDSCQQATLSFRTTGAKQIR